MIAKEYIEHLHHTFGVSIPKESFTKEIFDSLMSFKRQQIKENWKDDLLIWTLGNLDRYNKYFEKGSR